MRKAVAGAALGAAVARAAYIGLTRRPPRDEKLWVRTNHRGEPVTLLEGPAFAVGAVTAIAVVPGVPARMRAAAIVAGGVTGALGGYDDLAGSGDRRGFKGHLSALARGEVTTGAVKILGIGAAGLTAAVLAGTGAPTRRGAALDVLINGALIAGTANLLNLFDLRPGRAIKAGLLASPLVFAPPAPGLPRGRFAGLLSGSAVAAAPLGAALALLPEDLGERAMLGDAGANSLGALIGLAATGLSRRSRLAVLAGVTALNAASEVVSFTKVIQATPPLNRLDQLGRRPAAPQTRPAGTSRPDPM
ncbi:hypothetical protein NE235_19215 [Actinoallomurus spadix]|uniref:Glycosyl transferase family 4 n=1 Tax=Actinoallomurus spadix TaxID=79912 RepID=A0ABP3GJ08_9ACTN|nr:hypothetical protein [Actinoallomurus spadix]MCO5988237.1 hypothetical protein [Actinoallomurus spadix]